MLYTSSLLSHYLTTDTDPETLSDLLTLRTCEVEEIHKRTIPDDVVIGYVTETKKHPDADKLTVCQVDCGSKGAYQICCGADNVRKGIFVVVALPGCHLPAINLTIAPREMRGEESNGMICSKEELGIAEDLEQKWIRALMKGHDAVDAAKGEIETIRDMDDLSLDDVGSSLAAKYPYLTSWTLDVENKTITHRPDMFGHFGLAVELSTLLANEGKKYVKTELFSSIFELGKGNEIFTFFSELEESDRKFRIESDAVYTYTMTEVKNIQRASAGIKLRQLMSELGLGTNSNWIDLSNIFMNLTGQPVHFFDADKIKGEMVVRYAKDGEIFVDLFEREHILASTDVIIEDDEKIIDLVGIMGGLNTAIDENTKNISIEVANFDPVVIRKTGTRLGLRTDAELRFEKTINPYWSLICVKILYDFLENNGLGAGFESLAGSKIWFNESLDLDILKDIPVSRDRIAMMMGESTEKKESYIDILTHIGCQVHNDVVTVPARRSPDDLEVEACIIEEIARLSGFEHIEPVGYQDAVSYIPYTSQVKLRRNIESLLIDRHGIDQVETYPWILDTYLSLSKMDTSSLYEMENSLTPEQKYLRPTIIWSLLEAIEKNASFFDSLSIFDTGNIRKEATEGKTGERVVLGVGMYASKDMLKQSSVYEGSLFVKMRGLIDDILTTCEAKGKLQITQTSSPLFHPTQQAEYRLNGKIIGTVQILHPYIAEQRKLDGNSSILLAEIDITLLSEIAESQKKSTRGMSSYETLQDQIIRRDLSFVLDHEMGFGDITGAVRKIKEVDDVEVFDIYAGEHIGEGKKSIGLRFKMLGDGKMTTEQINEIMEKAIKHVESIGGVLR